MGSKTIAVLSPRVSVVKVWILQPRRVYRVCSVRRSQWTLMVQHGWVHLEMPRICCVLERSFGLCIFRTRLLILSFATPPDPVQTFEPPLLSLFSSGFFSYWLVVYLAMLLLAFSHEASYADWSIRVYFSALLSRFSSIFSQKGYGHKAGVESRDAVNNCICLQPLLHYPQTCIVFTWPQNVKPSVPGQQLLPNTISVIWLPFFRLWNQTSLLKFFWLNMINAVSVLPIRLR